MPNKYFTTTVELNKLPVLADIDAARTRGLRDEDLTNRLAQTVNKYLPLRMGNEEDVKKDVVSTPNYKCCFI